MSASLVLVLLVSAGAVGLASLALGGKQAEHRRLEVDLRAMALGRRGELVRRRRTGLPILQLSTRFGLFHLEYGSVSQRFDSTSGNVVSPTTMVSLELPRLLPALRASSPTKTIADMGWIRGTPVETGDTVFHFALCVRGPDQAGIRALLTDAVRKRMRSFGASVAGGARWALGFSLEPEPDEGVTVLRVRIPGRVRTVVDLDSCLEGMEALADGMIEAWDRPWFEAGARFGLQPTTPLQAGRRAVQGEVDGFSVHVWERAEDGPVIVEVAVDLALPVPLDVVHKELAQGETQATGNPVLDMLVAVRSDQPDRVRALLADEDLTEALLQVVHARKGSTLTERRLTLCESGASREGPVAAILDALALARALRAGVARLEGSA